ncbi:MAG: cell division protein FtsZ [Candidatus Micrarchaeota archaeon]|nr:cell division protein FtsZ [Candidatus Micrarchaeota archaeon]
MESLIESALRNTGKLPEEQKCDNMDDKIRISVVGVGGAGCNTISRLAKMGIKSADTIAINTDYKHLQITEADKRLLIGKTITKGLGAGGFPEIAMKCAEASRDKLREALDGAELVFIVAGMGGGTGTGAAPVVAELAKEQGAITVAIVTYPFSLERARIQKAEWGLEQLKKNTDTVIVIDNNRLVSYVPNLPMNEAFAVADKVTARAVKGLADTIMFPSLVNIDFADIRAIMGNAGVSVISVGDGKGTDKVNSVVHNTLEHPLLDVDYAGARGALIHIAGGPQLTLGEVTQIGEGLTAAFDPNANVIWGARLSPEMGDAVVVTAIMTGITSPHVLGKMREDQKSLDKTALEIDTIQYL